MQQNSNSCAQESRPYFWHCPKVCKKLGHDTFAGAYVVKPNNRANNRPPCGGSSLAGSVGSLSMEEVVGFSNIFARLAPSDHEQPWHPLDSSPSSYSVNSGRNRSMAVSAHVEIARRTCCKAHKLTQPRTVQRGKADAARQSFSEAFRRRLCVLSTPLEETEPGLDLFGYFLHQGKKYLLGSCIRNVQPATAGGAI